MHAKRALLEISARTSHLEEAEPWGWLGFPLRYLCELCVKCLLFSL